MPASEKPPIRVVTAADTVWSEAFHGPEEAEAPGREFTAAVSPDEKFSAGWWERDEQRRLLEESQPGAQVLGDLRARLTGD